MRLAASTLALVVASVLLAAAPARSAGERGGGTATGLASLRPGQWLRLEGIVQRERVATCTEVKQLTGDFLHDDWALRGTVRAVDAAKREFTIGGVRIRVTAGTNFGDREGASWGFSDLRAGMFVDVEGSYQKQGAFLLAAEVDDESDDLKSTRRSVDWIQLAGRAERVDPTRKSISAMGIVFQVTPKTRLRSVLR